MTRQFVTPSALVAAVETPASGATLGVRLPLAPTVSAAVLTPASYPERWRRGHLRISGAP